MIEAQTPDAADFTRRLTDQARKLAVAQTEASLLARRDDPTRWRRADLLWPLTAGDQ